VLFSESLLSLVVSSIDNFVDDDDDDDDDDVK
jgi:hypothetical protein